MRTQDTALGSATAERPEIPAIRLPEFVLGRARARGAKPALVEADSGRKISYEGLADAASGAASWLSAAGVRPGDVVALCAPNGIDFVIAWYAASSADAVVTTVNPLLTGDELASHFRATGTRWIVTTVAPCPLGCHGTARHQPAPAGTTHHFQRPQAAPERASSPPTTQRCRLSARPRSRSPQPHR
jgi:acyl-CoA synthetase (AMP-forming)/AMP-acid ligase II